MLPFIKDELTIALNLIIKDICMTPTLNIDHLVTLYRFAANLIKYYGMNAEDSIKILLFHDIDTFNISYMLLQMVKIIILKRDQTIIDLGGNKQLKTTQALQASTFS